VDIYLKIIIQDQNQDQIQDQDQIQNQIQDQNIFKNWQKNNIIIIKIAIIKIKQLEN
jgi:hypothetical protein